MSLEDKLKVVKIEYIKNFSHTLSEIKKNLLEENTSLLQNQFHKLKGSGKTYGFPEISKVGEVVEGICRNSPSYEILKKTVEISLELLKNIQSYYLKTFFNKKRDQESQREPLHETHNSFVSEERFELEKDEKFIFLKKFEIKKD